MVKTSVKAQSKSHYRYLGKDVKHERQQREVDTNSSSPKTLLHVLWQSTDLKEKIGPT